MVFYDDMQDVATELLTEFNQGAMVYLEATPAANEWESDTYTETPFNGVATGVEQRYVSDLVSSSDIKITAAVFGVTPTSSGRIKIDGTERQIVQVQQIPAAGTPVSWIIFVKG